MKKLIYSLIAVVTLALTVSTEATQYYATNNLAPSNHVILTVSSPITVSSITLSTTNVTPTLVRLIDGYRLQTNAAYTNYTTYTTNRVSSYVTSLGTTNLQTNTVLFYQANAVAASTTAVAEPLVALTVSSVAPVTVTPSLPWQFSKFLTLSNDLQGVNAVISYVSP